MERQYLGVAATAKLVRQALKESFPGQKFSVRSSSYAGGASIDVSWQDGPNSRQVDSVLGQFEGAYFDGMIDYKGSRSHRLDGQPVHFGADFVHGSRKYSDAMVERAIALAVAKFGGQPISVADYHSGGAWNWRNADGPNAIRMGEELNALLSKMSDRLEPEKSATLARIAFAGDDGYGAGTVGRNPAEPQGEDAYRAQNEARERADAAEALARKSAAALPAPGVLQ